ncbi:ParA family protein [Gluconacetobacter diazotrophicus]|uniref:ParA family protein n=1 Tax=Gluconacetobacter diazotrophicus TaxID=33996 RepID=A0A7W4I7Y8_GLUDI|nr:ParA family protein [Gluconacetobacter diazotrophicus]MBB2157910.1 ParA family protein [Gluconacetobacter diazotrophicus]
MPTIVFASSKGGVGKTTSALTLASVLAANEVPTALIDADPNAPIAKWAERFPSQVPQTLTVRHALGSKVAELIDGAQEPFVIVDLEGSRNVEVSVGLSRADLALIPMKGSQLDADEAANVVQLIGRQELIFKRKIPYRVFFAQTSPVIADKGMRNIKAQLEAAGIPMLKTSMVDRAAFKAPFQLGGTIYSLTPREVRNPQSAVENAEAFATEVRDTLIAERDA